jgi:hypothetical protein
MNLKIPGKERATDSAPVGHLLKRMESEEKRQMKPVIYMHM